MHLLQNQLLLEAPRFTRSGFCLLQGTVPSRPASRFSGQNSACLQDLSQSGRSCISQVSNQLWDLSATGIQNFAKRWLRKACGSRPFLGKLWLQEILPLHSFFKILWCVMFWFFF